VALTFEPEEVGYDPSQRLMRFCAADGPFPVRCAVATEVLAALEDDASAGLEAMLATYLRQKKLVQNILARKYSMGLLERDGSVTVYLADLNAQAAIDPISARPSPPSPQQRRAPA
jgi:hypothetical protein